VAQRVESVSGQRSLHETKDRCHDILNIFCGDFGVF
jgi:hypothetical protein